MTMVENKMKTTVNSIQAGVFKAKCLSLMDRVNKTHTPIIITKYGKPVAKLVPVDIKKSSTDFFGCLKNKISINADITKPIEAEWEANE
jgi:prevent-host-death family protein